MFRIVSKRLLVGGKTRVLIQSTSSGEYTAFEREIDWEPYDAGTVIGCRTTGDIRFVSKVRYERRCEQADKTAEQLVNLKNS